MWCKGEPYLKMTNTQSFAARELSILSKSATDPNDRPLIEQFIPEILALAEKFGLSGQSGGSAPYVANAISQAIKKLLLQDPICPIMGIDEEWVDVGYLGSKDEKSVVWQNNRCSALFKNTDHQSYYLDAIVWKGEEDYDAFTGRVEGVWSRQFVKSFPFTPKTFYIDVIREQLPNDWMEEPFIENKYYDTKEFEETGKKIWCTEKYRYKIKNLDQLAKVFEYYNHYI